MHSYIHKDDRVNEREAEEISKKAKVEVTKESWDDREEYRKTVSPQEGLRPQQSSNKRKRKDDNQKQNIKVDGPPTLEAPRANSRYR